MTNIRLTLFILVSMIVTIIELTNDPTFIIGRIFLAISAIASIAFAIVFVKDNWRPQPERVKKNE
ncbi:hypothetical protein [Companilactobacillus furfuricola]|uniref:hypothetical protein n=1 Tax=Companilactobacillus furfuricola TaxID=1462575 RepID=UPI000F79B013|nr:hypothetical protein [Companilactobacillus furfuricola]